MKPHLPLILLSALLLLCPSAKAMAPGADAIDLTLGDYTLDSDGTQTGTIAGDGKLIIASGEVQITTSNANKENNYTGITQVDSGATLKFTGADFNSERVLGQLGTSQLELSGTLSFFGEGPSVWITGGQYEVSNNIVLKDGAVIKSADGSFSFSGGLNIGANVTASMKMAWGKNWELSGIISGSGTLNLGSENSSENKVYRLLNADNVFTGVYNVDLAGGANDFLALVLGSENVAKDASIKLSGGASPDKAFLVLNETDTTIAGLSGNGKVRNGIITEGSEGKFTISEGTSMLTVAQTNVGEDVFEGTIDNNVNLTKSGVGTLTLTNIAAYTGNLAVQGGTLSLRLGSEAFELKGVSGTTGTLNLESGNFSISGESIGSVSLGGATLSANGATVLFDITGNESDKISFSGAVAGTLNLRFNLNNVQKNTAVLIMTTDSATNAIASLGALNEVSNQFYVGNFSASGNDILYTYTGYDAALLQWNAGGGIWSVGGNASWKLEDGTGKVFSTGDNVLFGDQTSTTEATITLDASGITAGDVLVESNSTNYIFSNGALLGDSMLVKKGDNVLTLRNSNSYSGGTQIEGGEIRAEAANALGIGDIALTKGTLVLGHADALSAVVGENTLLFNGGVLKYGTGITTDISGRIDAASQESLIVDTNGNNVSWGTAVTGFNYVKQGTGTLTLQSGIYAQDLKIDAGILAFGLGDVTLSGKLIGGANSGLSFTHSNADTISISGDTAGFLGAVSAEVENLNLVNGSLSGLAQNLWTLSAATKVNVKLNADKNSIGNYSLPKTIESVTMEGGTHELSFGENSTINAFTQTIATSNLTLKGTGMTFGTMKIGISSGVQAGTLTVAGKVTTGSFLGATINNARYTLNLQSGGELIVTGSNSEKGESSSMMLALKGYGEASEDQKDVTTFNMTGGTLKVENATMFFADDGHVTWNMSNGLARLKGLDMTNFDKKSKLYLLGGVLEIGGNGFVVPATSSQYIIEMGEATLAAYESWGSASGANISLGATAGTYAANGSKIRVDSSASIELSGVLSDKTDTDGKLVKTGDGVLTLSGANTYSGGTVVSGGVLIVGADQNSALGAGSVAVNNATLNMNGAALTNGLSLSGKSNLQNAQAYAGAEISVTLTDMLGEVSLGNLAAGKIASISTVIVDPIKGTTIENIGLVGTASTLTLGNSSLAVGLGNLFTSTGGAYPGSAEAILQFSQANGSKVDLTQNSTLTLDLRDADLIARMQELQELEAQTYQLLITNGILGMGQDSIRFEGLGELNFEGIENGNIILSGDASGVFTVKTGAVKTLTENTDLDVYNRVLVNGILNLNLPGVNNQDDGMTIADLGGSAAGIINITKTGATGTATVTLDVSDENSVYNGRINAQGADLYKEGAGTQTIGGELDLTDGNLYVNDGKLALNGGVTAEAVTLDGGDLSLGNTSTISTIVADGNQISLANNAILNLLNPGSALNGDFSISGKGALNLKQNASLSIRDNAKLDGVSLTLDGGSLDLGATADSSVSSLQGNGTLTMNQGLLSIQANANQISIFNGSLGGAGSLKISGQGIQELVGAGNADYFLDLEGGDLIVRGDSTTHEASYKSLDIGSGAVFSIGTIGGDVNAPMTRLFLVDGGAVNSGGTLRFIYNTNLDDALTSGPLLTTGGVLNIQNGSTVDVTTLDDNLTIPADFTDSKLNLVLAAVDGAGSIALDDGVNLLTGGLFKLSFENTALELDANGNLVLTGTTRRENLLNQAVTSMNTAAAADILWNNRNNLDSKSELGKLVASITNNVIAGNFASANHDMAASVGSTVTALHAAQKDDFYKQQMWIRNRVAQMGVNPEYLNDDMPYFNAWVQANSSYDKLNTSGDESGYKLTTWGGTVGFDVDLSEEWTLGAAFTASYGNLTAHAADSAKGDFDTYYANLFARMQVKKWSHSLIVSSGWNDMTLNRHVSYADGAYETRGATNGSTYGVMYEATYDIALNSQEKTILQPLFNASIQKSKVDAYRESGAGNAGLDVDGMDTTRGTIGLGARLMGMVGSNLFGREVLGELRVMAVQDLGDARSEARVGFINNPAVNARVRGAEVGRTGAQLGGSLVIPIGNDNSSIYIDVNADLRSRASSLNGNIGYRYNF